jgi:hypothetical protein
VGHHGRVERRELIDDVRRWLAANLPDSWAASAPEVHLDNDEILVVLPVPAGAEDPGTAIARFREATRGERMALAEEGEERFGRKVSWGGCCGGERHVFTSVSVPVMTRLRFAERATLDTLIDAGLARSRSEALAWCVRLVGAKEEAWIDELRRAFEAVVAVRDLGPRSLREEPAPDRRSG